MRPTLPSGLPAHWTSFVGRERDVAEVRRLLDEGTRLLTLVGGGGVGKTRLALHVVDGRDDVQVVELAALVDRTLLAHVVATAVGARERPGQDVFDSLTEELRGRRTLLLLDNCEHVLEAAASLVLHLLRTCPSTSVLATSREPLGVPGEVSWRVPSLAVPHRSSAQGTDELGASDAVRLFVDRARAVQPNFALHERNAAAVADIVCRLDGIPLAIELAAARVNALTPSEIAARLDDRFRLLAGGSQLTVARHQTLRAAVDWSFTLLSDEERRLLQQLSCFAGGWSLEAASFVCEQDDILDVLARLVDKSLVQVDVSGGASRYRLLESVRQYAHDQLQHTGAAETAHGRHAAYFLDLVQRGEPRFRGPEQQAWLERLDREHDNLRAALRWSIDHGVAASALLLSGGLAFFWAVRGYRREGLRWLSDALTLADQGPLEAQAKATGWAGYLASEMSDGQRAVELYDVSLRLRAELGDRRGHARILEQYGDLERRRGYYDRAAALLEQSLSVRRELGDQHGVAHALGRLGRVAASVGDFARSEALHDESLRLFEQLGDLHEAAHERAFLGQAMAGLGRPQHAIDLNLQALEYFRSINDNDGVAGSLNQLALLAVQRQQTDAQTAARCREALTLFSNLDAPWGVAQGLETAALVVGSQGQPLEALRLLGAADALRAAIELPLPPVLRPTLETAGAAARAELSPDAADTAWRAGRELRLDAAIAHACSLLARLSFRAADAPRHNLPAEVSRFIGRERAVEEVRRQLAEGRRVLTLTGAGGMGKTRLALRVAQDVVGVYPDGVWLVELAHVAEPSHVAPAIATALDIRQREDEPIAHTIAGALRRSSLLLVLDNCEHLLHACAELVEYLARSCPRLHVLVTSRQTLGVGGETVWRVPPLVVPPPSVTDDSDEIAASEAVRLFVDRAQAVVPTFVLTDTNAGSIAQICQQLDGIPLAIELAAARVEVLGLRQIAERVGDSLALLTRGSRTALPRHRTLRGALDWSLGLLADPERVLFRRLAVFSGGWTLDAAEVVCGPQPILDSLSELVNRSLVVAEAYDSEVRYRLLEIVRQYAAEQLRESGEEDDIRAGHLAWQVQLAERSARELSGPRQSSWLTLIEREQGNLRSAVAWGLASGAVESALRVATACAYYCQIHGHLYRTEARAQIEQALARSAETHTPAALDVRARALEWAGTFAADQFDYERAVAALDESLELWRELDNPVEIAGALTGLGAVARATGEYERSAALLEDALDKARAHGSPLHMARTLRSLAGLARERGDAPRALQLNREALDVYRAAGESHLEGHVLDQLGEALRDVEDHAAAQRAHADATALLSAAGCEEGVNSVVYHQARLAFARGDVRAALELSGDSLRVYQRLGVRRDVAGCLDVVAQVQAKRDPEVATRVFAAADALRRSLGTCLPPADRAARDAALAVVRASLGRTEFERHWSAGESTPLERIVDAALAARPIATPSESPSDAHVVLSAREREVAELIAEGLSNREIAERLVIAPRTAEAHVTHVLTKLGLRSRAQVAVWVVSQSSPR